MSEITYQREKFDPNHEGFKTLNDAHGIELRGMPTQLNIPVYLRIQNEGRLVLVTAKDGDIYVGYSSHIWFRHLHFDLRIGEDDAWYVTPAYRKQGVGRKLREFAIEELKKDNVDFVYGRLKVAHPHDDSMNGLGYKPWETVWIKDLKK